jgi:hypothetical protein
LLVNLKNDIIEAKASYDSLVALSDNGKTQELLNGIYGNLPTGQLKNKLVNNSPLSDTVLIAMNVTNPLSPGNYKNVMEKNLPVTRHVAPSFFERLNTLPVGIRNQLKKLQGSNPGVITPGLLEQRVEELTLTRQLLLSDILTLLTDTLNNRRQDAITLLEQENTPVTNLWLAGTYLSDGNYAEALAKISLLPDALHEFSEWKTYASIILNLYMQGKVLEQLDSSQIAYIRELAYECPENVATVNAKAVLSYLFREEVPACSVSMTKSILVLQNNGNKIKEYLGENYPDPFSGR